MSIGERVKFFRKRARMSQFQLEIDIGTSPGDLCRIEKGIVNPSKEKLFRIAAILKLNSIDTALLFGIRIDEADFNVNLNANTMNFY